MSQNVSSDAVMIGALRVKGKWMRNMNRQVIKCEV